MKFFFRVTRNKQNKRRRAGNKEAPHPENEMKLRRCSNVSDRPFIASTAVLFTFPSHTRTQISRVSQRPRKDAFRERAALIKRQALASSSTGANIIFRPERVSAGRRSSQGRRTKKKMPRIWAHLNSTRRRDLHPRAPLRSWLFHRRCEVIFLRGEGEMHPLARSSFTTASASAIKWRRRDCVPV